MKIIGSQTSPLVRVVRTLCHELEVPYELVETAGFGKITPEQHRIIDSNNPLMRVPVLVLDNEVLFESRIICQYLLRKHPVPSGFRYESPMSFDEENTLSTIWGAVESIISKFVILKCDSSIDGNKGYFSRINDRVDSAFSWLNERLKSDSPYLGKSFGLTEIALVSALEWTKKRKNFDWQGYSEMEPFLQKFKDRPSLQKSRIPENV